MRSHISAALRRQVERRASFLCEYCLIHARDVYVGCQVDHIISEKHDGPTNGGKLALACACCNRQKGSDIGSVGRASGKFIRLFNPRTDLWSGHFRLVGVRIIWRTPIGEATVRLLKFNDPMRISERRLLKRHGKFPSPAALEKIRAS